MRVVRVDGWMEGMSRVSGNFQDILIRTDVQRFLHSPQKNKPLKTPPKKLLRQLHKYNAKSHMFRLFWGFRSIATLDTPSSVAFQKGFLKL